MTGDKDLENGISSEQDQEDDPAMDMTDPSGFPEDDHAETEFPDEGFGDDLGAEEDFIEEDWEAYDEESFIDDTEGDGVAERKAAFTKLIIGAAVAFVLAAGGYFLMLADKPENMGAPVMEQVADATPVSKDQKVEFHSETKLQPKDSFGVTYGKQEDVTSQAVEPEGPQDGLMNDPQALARLRNRETAVTTPPGDDGYGDEETLPMPAPMSQAQSLIPADMAGTTGNAQRDATEGLIPMPEPLSGPSGLRSVQTDRASADIPRAPDVTRASMEGNIENAELSDLTENSGMGSEVSDLDEMTEYQEPVRAQTATMTDNAAPSDVAAVSAKLDRIGDRLDNIENSLEQIDKLQSSVSKLENRIAKLEKSPAKSAPQPSATPSKSSVSRSDNQVTSKVSPDISDKGWVLKSAQPGQAMIARKGESEMYSVSVGETFGGIGRVTGIYIENGRWVVQGTTGRVDQ